MLTRVDRVQVSAADPDMVATRWNELIGAKEVRQDEVPLLNAARRVLSVGTTELEILTPLGETGPVAEHLAARRGGPFAAGVATPDLGKMREHLGRVGISFDDGGDQLFLSSEQLGIPGLRVTISEDGPTEPHGLISHFYEVTHLTADALKDSAAIAKVFGLNGSEFVPIESSSYGYAGSLTLFRPDQLDRIETIDPYDRTKTMGRYFERFGASLYMCYGETDEIVAIRARARELCPHDWTGDDEADYPDGMFLHPKALGGCMMGISRTTYGWTWSGHPDWVKPAA